MEEQAVAEQAVIDRIEDGQHAVLLVGEEEREQIVPVAALPPRVQAWELAAGAIRGGPTGQRDG